MNGQSQGRRERNAEGKAQPQRGVEQIGRMRLCQPFTRSAQETGDEKGARGDPATAGTRHKGRRPQGCAGISLLQRLSGREIRLAFETERKDVPAKRSTDARSERIAGSFGRRANQTAFDTRRKR